MDSIFVASPWSLQNSSNSSQILPHLLDAAILNFSSDTLFCFVFLFTNNIIYTTNTTYNTNINYSVYITYLHHLQY